VAELFHQNYSPVAGSIFFSALVASIPPLLLALMLAYWRFAPWKSAIAGATSAFLLAWLVWGMPLP
jgi:lactate permease